MEPFRRTVRVHRREHVRHDPATQHDAHKHGEYGDEHGNFVIRRHVSVANAGDGLHRPVYRLQPPVAAVIIQVLLIVHAVDAPHPVRDKNDQPVDARDADERVVVDELVLVPMQQPRHAEQPQQLDQPEDAEELEQLQRIRIHVRVVLLRRAAPVGFERTPQRTLQRPGHEIHGRARHRVDGEPSPEVIHRNGPRLRHQHAGRLQLLPVPGDEVEEHVRDEVKIHEKLPPERGSVGWRVEGDPVRGGARQVAQHHDLEDVPRAPEPAVGVDVPPPAHGLGFAARILHGIRADRPAVQRGLVLDGGVRAQECQGGLTGEQVTNLVPP